MAKFSIGTVNCNKQAASAYIAYMMIGSYFKKAEMEIPIIEDKMRMDYRLMRTKEQEEIEEKIDQRLSHENAGFIQRIGELRTTVHVKTVLDQNKNSLITLWFETGFEEIVVLIDAKGKCFITKLYEMQDKDWKELQVEAVENQKNGNVLLYSFRNEIMKEAV